MSNVAVPEADEDVCANCGTAANDINLKKCAACELVRYCSIKCQREHRPQHKQVCKKRAAELHDEVLFKQPESSHTGDCPICCYPLSLDPRKCLFQTCCSKLICYGCAFANAKSNRHDLVKMRSCPFCRQRMTKEEAHKYSRRRVKANDPAALNSLGLEYHTKGDFHSAFPYFSKAAELGDLDAHYHLGIMYKMGQRVGKGERSQVYHFEKAAIGGHAMARHNLGCIEGMNGRVDRSVKHFVIAAKLGFDQSMKALWMHYSQGNLAKEDLDAALRAHKAAVDATKSPQREEADAVMNASS